MAKLEQLKSAALVLCLTAALAGCGGTAVPAETETPAPAETGAPPYDVPGEEPSETGLEETPPPFAPPAEGELSGSYYNDFLRMTLTLDADGTAALTGAETVLTGSYSGEGEALRLELDGADVAVAVDPEGDLSLEGYAGYFLRDWDFWGVTAAEAAAAMPATLGRETSYETVDNGDGTLRFRDFDHGVAFTCPADMTVLTDRFLGAVGVDCGEACYVVGRRVTDVYRTHSGSDDEFLTDYLRSFVFADFEALFGNILSFEDLSLRHDGVEGRLADATVRLSSGEGVWAARTVFYTSTYADGTVEYICKTLLAPAELEGRLDALADQVRDMGAVRLIAER